MKKFLNYIKEHNEIKIIELSYFDFINICDIYDVVDYKDNYNYTICDIVNQVKESSEYSKHSNKYRFLVALENKTIKGVFYKQLGGNPDIYDMGYIISKGYGKILLKEMSKLGSYTTFSNISNIPSMKSQLSEGAEIICICDNPPNKDDGSYNKDFFNNEIKQFLIDEKIYYKDDDDEYFFFDENENFNKNELKSFLLNHKNIKLIDKSKKDIGSSIKVYFLFNKI